MATSSSSDPSTVDPIVLRTQLEVRFDPVERNVNYHVRYIAERGKRTVEKTESWRRVNDLGEGSFGEVYLERCVQGERHQEVQAVKKIVKRPKYDWTQELRAIATFSAPKYHDFFVESFGWYESDRHIYIAMEFMEHGDLQRHLTAPIPESEGQSIVFQILQGLKFMHGLGFAHRDLKPENIMVAMGAPNWWVKIADFGLCKRTAPGGTDLRTPIGTFAFMAPEVYGLSDSNRVGREYTNAVDIWATGVIAFSILTAELPFPDLGGLARYVGGQSMFPIDSLRILLVSNPGRDLIQQCTLPKPSGRPVASTALRHPWFLELEDQTPGSRDGKDSDDGYSRSIPEPDHPPTPLFPSDSMHNDQTSSTAEFSATWESERPTTMRSSAFSTGQNGQIADSAQMEQTEKRPARSQEEPMEHARPEQPVGALAAKKVDKERSQAIRDQESRAPSHSRPQQSATDSAKDEQTLDQFLTSTGGWRLPPGPHGRGLSEATGVDAGKLNTAGLSRETVKSPWVDGRLKFSDSSVRRIEFSPDGRLLASLSVQGSATLWDTETGRRLRTMPGFEKDDFKRDIRLRSDGALLVLRPLDNRIAKSNFSISIYEANSEVRTWKRREEKDYGELALGGTAAFSADGLLVAVSARHIPEAEYRYNTEFKVWNTATEESINLGLPLKHPVAGNLFIGLEFSHHGGMLFAALANWATGKTEVLVWETEGWNLTASFSHSEDMSDMSISADGQLVALSRRANEDGRNTRRVSPPSLCVYNVPTSPGGEALCKGTISGLKPYRSRMFVAYAAFSPDGLLVAWSPTTGTVSGTTIPDAIVQIFEVKSCKLVFQFQMADVGNACLQFSPDGRLLAQITSKDNILLLDLKTLGIPRHGVDWELPVERKIGWKKLFTRKEKPVLSLPSHQRPLLVKYGRPVDNYGDS